MGRAQDVRSRLERLGERQCLLELSWLAARGEFAASRLVHFIFFVFFPSIHPSLAVFFFFILVQSRPIFQNGHQSHTEWVQAEQNDCIDPPMHFFERQRCRNHFDQ